MRCTLRPVDDQSAVEICPSAKFSPSFTDFRLPPPQVSCSSSDIEDADDDDEDDEDSKDKNDTFATTMHSASSLDTTSMTTSSSDCRMSDDTKSMLDSVEVPYRRKRSGRECPSPPRSSSGSSASPTRQSALLSTLAIHASRTPEHCQEGEHDNERDIDVDEDFVLFEQTTQMLSSPYHQLASLIHLGSTASQVSCMDVTDILSDNHLDDATASDASRDEQMSGISPSTSNASNVSNVLCLLCYGPQGDCEGWCAGKDLLDVLTRNTTTEDAHRLPATHLHPCDATVTDNESVSADAESLRLLAAPQEDDDYDTVSTSKDNIATASRNDDDDDDDDEMSLDTDDSGSSASAQSSSMDSLLMELQRANTPSSPTPQPSPVLTATLWDTVDKTTATRSPHEKDANPTGNESWHALMPRCKNGSSGAKHWCEQLQRHWYDTCEDAHCEPCIEAFFTSSMRGRKGEKEVAGAQADEGDSQAGSAPFHGRSRKRNSFAMLLAAVQKAPEQAPTTVFRSKSNNKFVSIADDDHESFGHSTTNAKASQVSNQPAKRIRQGASVKPFTCTSSALASAPTGNSRKSMILLRKGPSTPPPLPSMRRAVMPLVPTLARVAGAGKTSVVTTLRGHSPGVGKVVKQDDSQSRSTGLHRRCSPLRPSKIAIAVKKERVRRSPRIASARAGLR